MWTDQVYLHLPKNFSCHRSSCGHRLRTRQQLFWVRFTELHIAPKGRKEEGRRVRKRRGNESAARTERQGHGKRGREAEKGRKGRCCKVQVLGNIMGEVPLFWTPRPIWYNVALAINNPISRVDETTTSFSHYSSENLTKFHVSLASKIVSRSHQFQYNLTSLKYRLDIFRGFSCAHGSKKGEVHNSHLLVPSPKLIDCSLYQNEPFP